MNGKLREQNSEAFQRRGKVIQSDVRRSAFTNSNAGARQKVPEVACRLRLQQSQSRCRTCSVDVLWSLAKLWNASSLWKIALKGKARIASRRRSTSRRYFCQSGIILSRGRSMAASK